MSEVRLTVDGQPIAVAPGQTLRDACAAAGVDTPTLCWAPNLPAVHVCRVCVVEVEGSRTLLPACDTRAEAGMVVHTDSPRVRTSRKLVLELLASSVDTSTAPSLQAQLARYGGSPERFGPPSPPSSDRDARAPGHHHAVDGATAATVHQPVKVDNRLYVRDYGKCITCYQCVAACGEDAQNTFAIAIAGRGFDARVSTEFDVPLPDSACVYCGNCINACPTGALMFATEHALREAGDWREADQTTTRTVCSYCGVGCELALTVQDNRIVRVVSPTDSAVTAGNLCVKGRFGYDYVHADEGEGRG